MARGTSYEKAYAFAIAIVKICQFLVDSKHEFVLSKQLLRSGTSIGANLAEASSAFSEADLSSKASIAYKECQESKYWISLLRDTGYVSQDRADELIAQADELARILFATIRTLRGTKPRR